MRLAWTCAVLAGREPGLWSGAASLTPEQLAGGEGQLSCIRLHATGACHPLETVLEDKTSLSRASRTRWWRRWARAAGRSLIVVQSLCARWLDYLPRLPVTCSSFHDVRALVYERRATAGAGTLRERLARRRTSRRYRRFEREYCQRYDLVITVSRADEAWGPSALSARAGS